MLGMRQHYTAILAVLTNKYDVSTEDDGRFAAKLTPEVVSLFIKYDGISVEYLNGALLITPSFISDEKNYEPALQLAHDFALMLGMDTSKQESKKATADCNTI